MTLTAESLRRVEAAKPLLLEGLPIWRAAIAVGWGSPQLQIAFKKAEGVTPGQWLLTLPWSLRCHVYRRTLEQSENYLAIAGNRALATPTAWECAGCGAEAASRPPSCVKCGCGAFRPARQRTGAR